MQRGRYARAFLASIVGFLLLIAVTRVHADTPVVRAVLFYSPSCGHCHKVITEDLPPLIEKYGDQLEIIGINTADAAGSVLYGAAADTFSIPPENRGVPLLVVADVWLMGSADIPARFPLLIEEYLARGGTDWPDIPGLAEAIARTEAPEPTATQPPATPKAAAALLAPTLVPTAPPTATAPDPMTSLGTLSAGGTSGGFRARFDRDPVGNGLAVIVLAGMVAAFVWVVGQRPWRAWGKSTTAPRPWYDAAVPLLAVVGLAVASYLAYVETQQVRAVCGPVGDCNSVQQSDYALLFCLIPIAVLGVLGYLAILVAWGVRRLTSGRIAGWVGLALCVLAAGGVLFSIYLTFLEPFVIGATCAWCLSSAVIMTSLLLLSTALLSPAGSRVRLEKETGKQQASW
jgi:uncharacterized membrane protein/thiol-disulfide isomerase/thioredoxin